MISQLYGVVYPICAFYQESTHTSNPLLRALALLAAGAAAHRARLFLFAPAEGWDHPGWDERQELLKQNLGIANQLEETLSEQIKTDQSCTLVPSSPPPIPTTSVFVFFSRAHGADRRVVVVVGAISSERAQMYNMMRCEVCAVRTFIFWALRSEHQLYAAK
jgi:hypothetical protein